jgi:ATP adenylyltransferase
MSDERSNTPAHADAIHAPWRDAYMRQLAAADEAAQTGGARATPSSGCFLSDYWAAPERDEENFVVARVGGGASGGMILLNRYPYANGHLLVALGEGRGSLLEYEPEQQAALWSLVTLATELARETLNPQGVNIGINQGAAAGAGVPQHLHAHVVPRWNGDVNFITVVGQVRVIPSALEAMAQRYRETWSRLHPSK